MTQFGSEPEIWIERQPDPASPGRGPAGGGFGIPTNDRPGGFDDPAEAPPSGGTGVGPPDGPHRSGRARWWAVAVGFVVLTGAIVGLRALDGPTETAPTPAPSASNAPAPSATSRPSGSRESSTPRTTHTIAATPSTSARGVAVARVNPTPSIAAAGPVGPPGAPFVLVGLQWDGDFGSLATLFHYRSDTGAMVRTEVSSTLGGPLSFFTTADGTVIKPWGGLGGYLVLDGEPATSARGLLKSRGPVFPSAEPHQVWASSTDYQGAVTFQLTDATSGQPVGQSVALPPSAPDLYDGAMASDGAGYLLFRTIGGAYHLQPGKTTLVTHGIVLATGPPGWLVYDCDAQAECHAAMVDRATGDRHDIRGDSLTAENGAMGGVISADGHYAVLRTLTGNGFTFSVVDLATGAVRRLGVGSPDNGDFHSSDASESVAFTPDSRTALILAGANTLAVDPATGRVIQTLPIPPVSAIAIRPAQ